MKNIILTLFVFVSITILFGQKITLNDMESVKGYLDERKFAVGDYGTITFKYKEYRKDFNELTFNVIYEVPGQKKPKKLSFETHLSLEWNEFGLPSFTRPLIFVDPGLLYVPNFNGPYCFDLYETGDLYYMDKPTFNMEEYIDAKTSGLEYPKPKSNPYKLCNKL